MSHPPAPRRPSVVLALAWRQIAGLFSPPTRGLPLCVVFSKDRALQLDALLRSWARHARNAPRPVVLWRASDERHARAYQAVFERHAATLGRDIRENSFRDDLLTVLRAAPEKRVLFLVDDLLLVKPFDFADFEGVNPLRAVACPRLGPEITHCQTQGLDVSPPPLTPHPRGRWLSFSWSAAGGDWAMPLSVDGNLFDRKELLAILSRVPFRAPNSLEHALGPYRFAFRFREGLCPPSSVLCNLPVNQVQNEGYQFPHAGLSAETFLQAWEEGMEICLEDIETMPRNACHMAVVPRLLRR